MKRRIGIGLEKYALEIAAEIHAEESGQNGAGARSGGSK